jgi:hypothetical protein
MKLGDEPMNWLGLALLLLFIAVVALSIHWMNMPKLPA